MNPPEPPPSDPSLPTILVPDAGGTAGANEHSPAAPPLTGADNYQLGREIARGGMGSILEAEDAKLKRTVAVKIMLFDSNADESVRQRFVREAEVLALLAHPNIVPIHDLVWEDGLPLFYTMKLVKGRTLQAILNDLRKSDADALRDFTLDRLLLTFRKICDAIAFAHSKGIIHRDLKPENIMVGEFGEVLVMDWGLAKRVGSAECGVRSAG
jgi:serine/threonine protein kinase